MTIKPKHHSHNLRLVSGDGKSRPGPAGPGSTRFPCACAGRDRSPRISSPWLLVRFNHGHSSKLQPQGSVLPVSPLILSRRFQQSMCRVSVPVQVCGWRCGLAGKLCRGAEVRISRSGQHATGTSGGARCSCSPRLSACARRPSPADQEEKHQHSN